MKYIFLVLIFSFTFLTLSFAQSDAEKEYNAEYAQRIKLSRIEGVYIPKDMPDAFVELQNLSEPAGIQKFKLTSEDVVASRLQGGIGRWMQINWSFFEGSRFSHYLKSLGLHHPDDMSVVVMVSFHRHLNDLPLDIESQVLAIQKNRAIEHQERLERRNGQAKE